MGGARHRVALVDQRRPRARAPWSGRATRASPRRCSLPTTTPRARSTIWTWPTPSGGGGRPGGAGRLHAPRLAGVRAGVPGRIINLHPALLPAFPGTTSISDAWNYGVKVTGVTVHFVDEGLDTGPIIAQEPVRVEEGDTPETPGGAHPRRGASSCCRPHPADRGREGQTPLPGTRVVQVDWSDERDSQVTWPGVGPGSRARRRE